MHDGLGSACVFAEMCTYFAPVTTLEVYLVSKKTVIVAVFGHSTKLNAIVQVFYLFGDEFGSLLIRSWLSDPSYSRDSCVINHRKPCQRTEIKLFHDCVNARR